MNENKRILLVAIGILVLIASDPLVSATFETPRSVCVIARNLAVSAFDSLVRSTLPLSSDQPEVERTEEVLVAGPAKGKGTGRASGESDRSEAVVRVLPPTQRITELHAGTAELAESTCIPSKS